MKIKEALKKLPNLYSTDSKKGDLPAVYIFVPGTNVTWVLWEYSPTENEAFGLCDLGFGFPEMGYVDIDEMESVKGPLDLPPEMDESINTRFAGYKNAGVPIPSFLR